MEKTTSEQNDLLAEPIFDRKMLFRVPLIDGRKVTIAYPDDKQLEARSQSVKIITKKDHDSSFTDTKRKPGFDLQLAQFLIQQGDEPATISEADATKMLDRITDVNATEAEREGLGYRVTVRLPMSTATFFFERPTQEQVFKHDQSLGKGLVVRNGVQEFKISYGNGGELFDLLVDADETTGYADPKSVPINHKSAAVQKMLAQIERDIALDNSEDF